MLTISMAASAAGDKFTAVKNSHGVEMIYGIKPATVRSSNVASTDATQSVLFSSMASDYPNGTYWCCGGAAISGLRTDSGQKGKQWWAAAQFTPKKNSIVTGLGLPIQYETGNFTHVIVTLNADDNGVPGDEMGEWELDDLGAAGDCCNIPTVAVDNLAVTAGVVYWVVVKTENRSDITAVWPVAETDQVNSFPLASYNSSTGVWSSYSSTPNLAFEVYGSKQ